MTAKDKRTITASQRTCETPKPAPVRPHMVRAPILPRDEYDLWAKNRLTIYKNAQDIQ